MTSFQSSAIAHYSRVFGYGLLVLCCTLLLSCGQESPTEQAVQASRFSANPTRIFEVDPELSQNIRELMQDYMRQIDTDFAEVETSLLNLNTDIEAFLAAPNQATLAEAGAAWLAAHRSYELTALHRYFAGLAMPEPDSLELFQLQYQMNQWPILPGYIDYVDEYPESGIVHDMTVLLNIENIRLQHGEFDLSEATLGFHVIEFLLWGENSEGDSPRPVSDYLPLSQLTEEQIDNELLLEQLPANRRRVLLSLLSDALYSDFLDTRSLWTVNSQILRSNLTAMDSSELLPLLMDAITEMLTEELLIRSLYPLLNGEFTESIQSPYSHTTQNAVAAQLSGIERLMKESTTSRGTTLDLLLNSLSENFADFFYQNFDASKECLVLLYSNMKAPEAMTARMRTEFEIVECINLVTNIIDHLQQIKLNTI